MNFDNKDKVFTRRYKIKGTSVFERKKCATEKRLKLSKTNILLGKVQNGGPMPIAEQATLALYLAFPAIISQLITILMEYVDSAMVGQLGASASASIGIVSTTTWLMGGLCSSIAGGFGVMVAQSIGARNNLRARQILRVAIRFTLVVSSVIGLIGIIIAPFLPQWLGGEVSIQDDATTYFLVFSASIPIWEVNYLMASMLRSTGNMKVPSIVNIVSCLLNVGFNYVFIFVCGWGVLGAAIGTACSITIASIVLTIYVLFISPELRLFKNTTDKKEDTLAIVKPAMHIGIPMAVQHIAICSAYIVSTLIVAPLGTIAIAAHSFGITIEGLCYMPGYGIGDAATTLVGQSIGARREDLQRSFSVLTVLLGCAFMTVMGILMYAGVPYLMPLMTPDVAVQQLTVECLRIEAFAEPLYAVAIVTYSVFMGAADTKVPAAMNLGSMWIVRLPMAYLLAQQLGLKGVWIAMCAELCFRGTIFLIRLIYKLKTQKITIQLS